MATTDLNRVPPNVPSFRLFLGATLAMSALKLAIQILGNVLAQHAGYGIFRDEMYYLICGRHLAFGYVDQPPMVALQARLTEMLFGFRDMWSLRLFSAIAGAVKVFLTGTLVWAMGGRRLAAVLAMLGVTVAGAYLGIDGFLSMNSFEPVFWMSCVLALIRIVEAVGRPELEPTARNWWIVLGVSAGLGLENKDNIVFFLVAVLIAVLLTPQRRILASRWFAVAVGLTVMLALPNLLWQIYHHWPTLEWLHDVAQSDKNVNLPPVKFVLGQIVMLTPWTAPLWVSGVAALLFVRRFRPFLFLGLLYPVFLAMMIALHAKDYYLAPIYPVYFAAGAMLWLPVAKKSVTRMALVGGYALLLVAGFVLTVPFSIPVLPPQQFLAWERTMHFAPPETENHAATPLPQFYADRLGWQEMVTKVAEVYDRLTPGERAEAGIYATNYGEASAINLFGPEYGLPTAISGHQNYWLWGPHGYSGQVMILITGDTPSEVASWYSSCKVAARLDDPLAMPWEHKPIYLCSGRIKPYSADWEDFKHYY